MDKRPLVITRAQLKAAHPRCMCSNMEAGTGQHDGGSSLFLRNLQEQVPLKCIYTNAYGIGNKQKEFEICMQLQGCSFIGVSDVGLLTELECCSACLWAA